MAENTEGKRGGPQDDSGGADSLAVAMALGTASREKADAFLDKQSRIADLQIEDLEREDSLRHWSVVVRHISDVLRMAFELALAVILIGFVAAVGSVVWTAAHDDSLVIEAFSVPPEMAQSGLTGQAIAAQLQDKLSAMQVATDSGRPAKSYASSWGDGIKVMIPNTGISVGDVYRTLAGWLGHQTHITGEVYRTPKGIAITARSNGKGGATATGSEADFDALLQKTAEAIYQHTQPYRYAVYLAGTNQHTKAMAIYKALAANGDREDKLWSHMGISSEYEYTKPYAAPGENRKALAIDPDFILAHNNIGYEEVTLGHLEIALAESRKAASLIENDSGQLNERARAALLPMNRGSGSYLTGDFKEALKQDAVAADLPDYGGDVENSRAQIADLLSLSHDNRGAQTAWANLPVPAKLTNAVFYYPFRVESEAVAGNWAAVAAVTRSAEQKFAAAAQAYPVIKPGLDANISLQVWPYAALARAETGDIAGAEALIAKTPRDCDLCVRMRGRIATIKHDWKGAAHWFAMVSARTPSIPFADTDWGAMLLARGDLDAAIAKLESAHKKGPHFADPLEMWGEALIAKNRSDLALAKFEEADKDAPKWGRLHLKWGEALLWSGDRVGAKTQFAIAAKLWLASTEKSQLARVRAHL